jgi:Glycosyltransferase Family 4
VHLLHIIPTYKPAYCYGGPVVSIGLLCENLVAKGNCQVTVLSTTANGKTELPVYKREPKLVEGVQVYYFPRWTKDHSMLSPALLWYLFKNAKRFDAVHIHSWWNLSVLFATMVCILRGVKPVLSPRGMLSSFSITGRFKPAFHKTIGTHLLKQTFLHSTSPQDTLICPIFWIPQF